jgi:hypothetical protein
VLSAVSFSDVNNQPLRDITVLIFSLGLIISLYSVSIRHSSITEARRDASKQTAPRGRYSTALFYTQPLPLCGG